jgi:hypothetical protein
MEEHALKVQEGSLPQPPRFSLHQVHVKVTKADNLSMRRILLVLSLLGAVTVSHSQSTSTVVPGADSSFHEYKFVWSAAKI